MKPEGKNKKKPVKIKPKPKNLNVFKKGVFVIKNLFCVHFIAYIYPPYLDMLLF